MLYRHVYEIRGGYIGSGSLLDLPDSWSLPQLGFVVVSEWNSLLVIAYPERTFLLREGAPAEDEPCLFVLGNNQRPLCDAHKRQPTLRDVATARKSRSSMFAFNSHVRSLVLSVVGYGGRSIERAHSQSHVSLRQTLPVRSSSMHPSLLCLAPFPSTLYYT